jgi:hypothetical protein
MKSVLIQSIKGFLFGGLLAKFSSNTNKLLCTETQMSFASLLMIDGCYG